MMGGGHPVADAVSGHPFPDLDDLSGHFMPQDQGGLVDTVPFQDIAAADAAGLDADEDLIRSDLGLGHLFQADVPIVVIHGYAHGSPSALPFLPAQGETFKRKALG
jgi:hypothetical protein